MGSKSYITINCCDNPASVRLTGRLRDKIEWDQREKKAEILVDQIKKILAKNNLRLADVAEIRVNRFCRRGSYTGHRVAIAVANALNWSAGRKKIIAPEYGLK